MFKKIGNLCKAVIYSSTLGPQSRKRTLLAQYHRAEALPSIGSKTFSNLFADVKERIDISVIITCYNYKDFIVDAMNSVLRANSGDLAIELVVVDDASRDQSSSLIKEWMAEARFPMQLLRNHWNVGVSKSRNIGISKARGEFVFILDADNLIAPDALLNLHRTIRQNNADAAFGPIRRCRPDGSFEYFVSDRPFDPDYLLKTGNYIDAMALFRRNTLLEIGGYDVSLLRFIGGWEDYNLWLEFIRRELKVAFTSSEIGVYRVKPDSMVCKIKPEEIAYFFEFNRSRSS